MMGTLYYYTNNVIMYFLEASVFGHIAVHFCNLTIFVMGEKWCAHDDGVNLKVLVTTIDAQWEGMGDVGSARYEPALLPP